MAPHPPGWGFFVNGSGARGVKELWNLKRAAYPESHAVEALDTTRTRLRLRARIQVQ
jgi:hypothetical protein